MPVEFQERMVALINEMREAYDPFQINDNYIVLLRDRKQSFTGDPLRHYKHPPNLPYRKV